MDFTVQLSRTFGQSPFDVLRQDKDEVIMLINYFIEKDSTSGTAENVPDKFEKNHGAEKRIRVNDKTATGGWF